MKLKFHSKKKIGMPPGSLVYMGESKESSVSISLIEYSESSFEEKKIEKVSDLKSIKENDNVSWINVCGLNNIKILEEIGNIFEIHPLVLEDVLNVYHHPKMDEFEEYLFLILKMVSYDNSLNKLDIEHVCFVLGKNYFISFQEKEGDVFDLIRDRLRNNKGKIRKLKVDYLMYRLIDAIVDNYLVVLENYNERIEDIEDELLLLPDNIDLDPIHGLRKEIIKLRRIMSPLSEIIHSFQKEKFLFIQKGTIVFFRDLYDHIKLAVETTENFRELISGLLQIYLSSVSHRMNNIMKLLTIVSTIFIPLTFIVGIYGMNFNPEASAWNMPELHWKYGYPVIMFCMLMVAVGLIFFFKKKKWL